VLLLFHLNEAGPPVASEQRLRSSTQAILLCFSRSHLRMLDRCLPPCWAAGCRLPWARARDGMGVSKVEMDGQHEKSKRSRPPRVSKTTLPQPPAARQARYCWPLSLPHVEEWGAVTGCRAGRLPFISTLYTGEGSEEKGGGESTAGTDIRTLRGAALPLKQDCLQ
jgi:hypothetical protein